MSQSTEELEILDFMRRMEKEPLHPTHVCFLALQIVSQLEGIVPFTEGERFILHSASLLHDIGWTVAPSGKKHHKESARLIRENSWQTIPDETVNLIAAVARYHRKSMPSESHPDFGPLSLAEREVVSKCAAVLRIADGLDRSHGQKVMRILVEAGKGSWLIRCFSSEVISEEFKVAKEKADLAEKTFGVVMEFQTKKWVP